MGIAVSLLLIALGAILAWAVTADMDPERSRIGFDTAVRLLEQETTILLGRPPLREDTEPYLGRSSAMAVS